MVRRSKTPRSGWSPGKIVVIGVLSIALLLVIVSQFGGRKRSATSPPAARRTAGTRSGAAPSPIPADAAAPAKRSEQPWPTFNLAEVVTSNPFALPDALIPRREAGKTLTLSMPLGEAERNVLAIEPAAVREMRRRQAEFMEGLRAQGVDMILKSPRGSVARIGELSLRVGEVHEGLRVKEIGENGIIFAPVTAAEGQPE